MKATYPKQGKNEVQGEKNEIHIGHERHHELNGPDTEAGWTVAGTRVLSEHKYGPHDSSKDIQQNRDHQEYKHKPVQVKRQTFLQFLEDVGSYDDREDGEGNDICYNTHDQSWAVSVTSQWYKNNAAHKGLHNFQESRQNGQVSPLLLVQEFVLHHFKCVDKRTQESTCTHYQAIQTFQAGVEVGIGNSNRDSHECGGHGHPRGEVGPVHAKHVENDIELKHFNDGDDEGHDWAEGPGEHSIVPVGMGAPSSEGSQEKGEQRQNDLSHVQPTSSGEQSGWGKCRLGQCVLNIIDYSHLWTCWGEVEMCL